MLSQSVSGVTICNNYYKVWHHVFKYLLGGSFKYCEKLLELVGLQECTYVSQCVKHLYAFKVFELWDNWDLIMAIWSYFRKLHCCLFRSMNSRRLQFLHLQEIKSFTWFCNVIHRCSTISCGETILHAFYCGKVA